MLPTIDRCVLEWVVGGRHTHVPTIPQQFTDTLTALTQQVAQLGKARSDQDAQMQGLFQQMVQSRQEGGEGGGGRRRGGAPSGAAPRSQLA